MKLLICIVVLVLSLIIYWAFLKNKKMNLFFYIMFVLYGLCVFFVTLMPSSVAIGDMTLSDLMHNVNLIPLGDNNGSLINAQEFSQCIQNAIMFMPLGILLPLTFKHHFSLLSVILISMGISCFIEMTQLFCTYYGFMLRSFDINDIIFNTIGAVMTFSFVRFIELCLFKYYRLEKKEQAKHLS